MPRTAKVACLFRAQKVATFGLSDVANLDEVPMWPTAFALMELTAADESRIGALVKEAVR